MVLVAVFLGLLLLPGLPEPKPDFEYTTVTPKKPDDPTPPKMPVNTTNKSESSI